MKSAESGNRLLPAERSLVALLDGDAVRFFLLEGEQIEELGDAAPQPPAAGKGRGAAGARGRAANGKPAASEHGHNCRHGNGTLPVMGAACDRVHRAADRVAQLARAEHPDRILAGGHPECVAELRRILRARLGGDIEAIPVTAGASSLEVAGAVRAGARAEPSSHEERVLGELIEAVGRGLVALGAAAVAEAVNEHRATVLIIPRAASIVGASCPACEALFALPAPAACPACGERPVPVDDFLERLAAHVREGGGHVEEINGPAGETLRAYGGLAALLRYTFPSAGRTCPWAESPETEGAAAAR
ncbi:MAG TPA: hypothetical protein VF832_10985 [Longimicrobiales bacterium]